MNKIGIVLILMGLIVATYGIMEIDNVETSYKEVKCYDRFKNEIKGLICEKEIYSNQSQIMLICLLSAILISIGIFQQAKEVFF